MRSPLAGRKGLECLQKSFLPETGVLGAFQRYTAFLLGSIIVPSLPSLYFPGTDSETIEIGFGLAESEQAADCSLPKDAASWPRWPGLRALLARRPVVPVHGL